MQWIINSHSINVQNRFYKSHKLAGSNPKSLPRKTIVNTENFFHNYEGKHMQTTEKGGFGMYCRAVQNSSIHGGYLNEILLFTGCQESSKSILGAHDCGVSSLSWPR